MPSYSDPGLTTYANLKLAALGQPVSRANIDPSLLEIAGPLLRNHYQKDQLLGGILCPADKRIQGFLDAYLSDVRPQGAPRLPGTTFVLDRPGLGRILSLPATCDSFRSPYASSYRVAQGVLHNPKADRRTTHGIFHIVEGGLPIPADKTVASKLTFARLLERALQAPAEALRFPFTAGQDLEAHGWVSLLLRPLVCPATPAAEAKTMEIRFFAPASLVSNLDFVESIFGNAGDPFLSENDAALDPFHWTGHTGCVIVAPHLVGARKVDLGLPHLDQANDLQRRHGMCWRDEDEIYNEGRAFKMACRDHRGVMVTIIADSYFGYCKKEVKTQISYAANLSGLSEEEHAGGAIAYPTYVLGQDFFADRTVLFRRTTFEEAVALLGDAVDVKPERYAIDRRFPNIFYVPENTEFSVREGYVRWAVGDATHQLPLLENCTWILPSGYKIHLAKQASGTAWRLVGSAAFGTVCHKPCTVSGGGKSEISKSIAGSLLGGPVFVGHYTHDMAAVAKILKRDYSSIYKTPRDDERGNRPILSPDRSLGSVIKLLTPSADYTDDYNQWLCGIPHTIRQLVVTIKRYYRADWDENWAEHFTVDRINGHLGHELKYDDQKLIGNYLRVGYDPEGAWRIYKLRPDFHPADKVQIEDDITASVVLPRSEVPGLDFTHAPYPAVKLVANCEAMLFQRPDDAVHRGVDKQAELDIATPGTFLSNYEPLSLDQARRLSEVVVHFDQYTEPMKRLLRDFINHPECEYIASSAHPRLVNGVATKNPRYLQRRPDRVNARDTYIGEIGTRLNRQIPTSQPLYQPVHAVLAGRRNNPPDPSIGLPPLAVYNPIHYQETPELFMDFIASLTGKSPSTTGFGSEGALTKGPFNALLPILDLNNALVAAILTTYGGFTTAAGHVGPHYRVDHDVTMIVPEVWCRMRTPERQPQYLIENGYLEKLEDFDHNGERILASRLGWRITRLFADHFLGRMFETPDAIFTPEMLRPELQDREAFISGVRSIVDSEAEVARTYFEDGSIELAAPPLRALLHIMAFGQFEGKNASHPDVRKMFTRDWLLSSAWYRERLNGQRQTEIDLWTRHVSALEEFSTAPASAYATFDVAARLHAARTHLSNLQHLKPQHANA